MFENNSKRNHLESPANGWRAKTNSFLLHGCVYRAMRQRSPFGVQWNIMELTTEGGGGGLLLCRVTCLAVVSCHVPHGSWSRMGGTCVTYVTCVGCAVMTRRGGGFIGSVS